MKLFGSMKDLVGLSMAGKMQKYVDYYRNSLNNLDVSKVNCSVHEEGYKVKYYTFSASCYCDDTLALPNLSDSLVVFTSKKFETRLEAEAALDIEIMAATKILKESSFYRQRYYPELDALGETLCCKNSIWSIVENKNLYRCPECSAYFEAKPESALCNKCGGLFL